MFPPSRVRQLTEHLAAGHQITKRQRGEILTALGRFPETRSLTHEELRQVINPLAPHLRQRYHQSCSNGKGNPQPGLPVGMTITNGRFTHR